MDQSLGFQTVVFKIAAGHSDNILVTVVCSQFPSSALQVDGDVATARRGETLRRGPVPAG